MKKCPICKIGKNEERFGKYVRCRFCRSLFLERPPDQKSIQKSSDDYADIVTGDSTEKTLLIHKERLQRLSRYLPKKCRILDVGCGRGSFLELISQSGYVPVAMDIASKYVGHLKKKGIKGYTNIRAVPENSFDAITSFDVIEHTTNPQKFIQDIKKKLKKNGYIMVTTPNLSGISGKILGQKWWVFGPDGHFTLFCPNSLRIILENNGFEIISCRTDIFTQWLAPSDTIIKKIINKILYLFFHPVQTYLYSHNLGDNIEILARKVK